MSKEIRFIYRDDLTNEEVDQEAIETVEFSYKGIAYEIDLGPASVEKFDKAVAKFIENGRKAERRPVTVTKAPRVSTGSGLSKQELAAAREWLISKGHEVAPRGRIKADLIELYQAEAGR